MGYSRHLIYSPIIPTDVTDVAHIAEVPQSLKDALTHAQIMASGGGKSSDARKHSSHHAVHYYKEDEVKKP